MRWFDRKIDAFIRHVRDTATTRIPIGPGGADDPTYWRYFVIPRNRFFNVYLHNFLKDDEEHHHDHRMVNISIILQGEYFEERFAWRPVEGFPLPGTARTLIRRLRPLVRLPSTPHRVVLRRNTYTGKPVPIWSLFIRFPQVRQWGFYCPGDGALKWVRWDRYVAVADPLHPGYGKRGAGCDG